MKVACEICPHHCKLEEGQSGFCHARRNEGGRIVCANYGQVTALALDPIEKKPLARFFPGSRILSVGSYGCNLRCPFCQNHSISMASQADEATTVITPEQLVEKALQLVPQGNIGIAYTYNEPLIGYEFVADCAKLSRQHNLKNVLVTNGTICEKPLMQILPFIDAMNIDLKGFTQAFYDKLSGDLKTVKKTISLSAQACHVEVTTLLIPGENDSEEEIESLCRWLAGISSEIPLHLSRFFPRYRYNTKHPTPVNRVYERAALARRYLKYVYTGNC